MSFSVSNPGGKNIIKGTNGLAQTSNGIQVIGSDSVPSQKNISIVPPTSDASFLADYKLTLPPNAGSSGQVLTTDGAGVLSWSTGASQVFTRDADGNIFGGTNAGQNIGIGTNNFGAGDNALDTVSSGARNVGIGLSAGGGIIASSNNVVIGYEADIPFDDSANSVVIGPQARATSGNLSVAIGNDAKADIAQAIAIGNSATASQPDRALGIGINPASVIAGAPPAANAYLQCTINGVNYVIHLTQA